MWQSPCFEAAIFSRATHLGSRRAAVIPRDHQVPRLASLVEFGKRRQLTSVWQNQLRLLFPLDSIVYHRFYPLMLLYLPECNHMICLELKKAYSNGHIWLAVPGHSKQQKVWTFSLTLPIAVVWDCLSSHLNSWSEQPRALPWGSSCPWQDGCFQPWRVQGWSVCTIPSAPFPATAFRATMAPEKLISVHWKSTGPQLEVGNPVLISMLIKKGNIGMVCKADCWRISTYLPWKLWVYHILQVIPAAKNTRKIIW